MGAFCTQCYCCEHPNRFRRLIAASLAEFVGTFFFVTTIAIILGGGATVNGGFAALAIGVIFAVLVFHGIGISGGQYNPAITIGVAISNSQFGSLRMVYYIVAQFLGGILGGLMAINLITEVQTIPEVGAGFSQPKAVLVETIFAFLLVYTVIRTNEKGDDYGFYVGAVQFVGSASALGLTGAVFNPAVAAGLYAGSNHLSKLKDPKDFWVYIFAPLIGGILAAVYSGLLNALHEGAIGADSSSEEETSDNETPGNMPPQGVQMATYTPGVVQPRPQPQPVPMPQPQYGRPVYPQNQY